LAYSQTEKPSREKLASELKGLAGRVAGGGDPKLVESVKDLGDAIARGKKARATLSSTAGELRYQEKRVEDPKLIAIIRPCQVALESAAEKSLKAMEAFEKALKAYKIPGEEEED
jgi:hypothetical protein